MRPRPKKVSVSTSETSEDFGVNLRSAMIKNQGTNDCLIDFDEATSADSYLLEAGETLTMEFPFVRLYHKTNTGATTLYIVKIFQ